MRIFELDLLFIGPQMEIKPHLNNINSFLFASLLRLCLIIQRFVVDQFCQFVLFTID